MTSPAPAQPVEQAGEAVREAASDAARAASSGLQPVLDFELVRISGLSVTVGALIAAVLVLVAALLVSALLRRMLKRYGDRHAANANHAALYTVSRLVHYALLALGIFLALNVAGIPLGKFAIFAGAIGVGLGFGLQAIFSNFISGIILLFDRSLKVGDFVELESDIRGTVRAINIRATRITTNDNIDVLVPNSEFVSGRVVNWTHGSYNRRIRVPFGVAYGVDKELVKKAVMEAAGRVPFTLAMEGDKRPQVWLTGFGDSAVEFQLVVWLTEAAARRNAAIKAAYLWEIDTALKDYGIEIPFPQNDLNVRSLFGLTGKDALAALKGGHVEAVDAEPARRELDPQERAALSGNDARMDTEQQIEEDAARAAADEQVRNAPKQD